MATDPNLADNTKWSSLAGSGDLMLESGVAEKCAQHVETALNTLSGIHTYITDRLSDVPKVPTGAPEYSGIQLLSTFQAQWSGTLLQRMDQHRLILTDMGKTFVAAGKAYAATEHDNATMFDNIKFDTYGTGTPPSGSPPQQAVPTDTSTSHSSSGGTGSYVPWVGGAPETGSQLGWTQLWQYGNSMDPQGVANAGGAWTWLSGQLDTTFGTLRDNISAVSDQWTGLGATAAIGATTQYVNASKDLTSDMNSIGANLVTTSGWMQQTKSTAMPPTQNPPVTGDPTSAQNVQNELIKYQDNWTTYYTANFPNSAGTIVALPQPNQVTNSGGNTSGNGTTDTNGNNNNANNPNDNSTNTANDVAKPDASANDNSLANSNSVGNDNPLGNNTNYQGYNPTDNSSLDTNTPTDTNNSTSDPLSSLSDPAQNLAKDLATPSDSMGLMPVTPPLSSTGAPVGAGSLGRGGLARGLGRGLAAEEKLAAQESKLFPRSAMPPEERIPKAGLAEEGREPGYPLGAGRGKKDEEKERKRLAILNSDEHLDEAMGTMGRIVRPVLDR